MADDIDIEEHSVLDNPRIRHILPTLDLGITIKTEAPDEDEPGIEEYENSDTAHTINLRDALSFEEEKEALEQEERVVNYPILRQMLNETESPYQNTRISEEYVVHNNKIILGNKPCNSEPANNATQSLLFGFNHLTHVKTEPLDYDEDEEHDFEEIRVTTHTPVMILGSKPNKGMQNSSHNRSIAVENSNNNKVDDETYQDTNVTKDPFPKYLTVYLQDWGPKLDRSASFCKECKILFPTRNCLDSHKMAAHSFLVPLDTNVAVKSTAKSHITARKSTQHEPSTSKARFCNHCNKSFPDDTALIKHLYEIVTSEKKIKCDMCHNVFPNETDLQLHMKSHAEQNIVEEQMKLYQCHICGYYMKTVDFFYSHMNDNHKIVNIREPEMVPFNPKCLLCKKAFSLEKNSYNKHVLMKHENYFNMDTVKAPVQPLNNLNDEPECEAHFKCQKCDKSFVTYNQARKHRHVAHAETSSKRIFSKVFENKTKLSGLHKVPVKKTSVISKVPLNSSKTSNIDSSARYSLIPKDVLFKCNCLLYFTNYSAAYIHTYKCSKNTPQDALIKSNSFQCELCDRSFMIEDQSIHEMQHKLTVVFKVYHVTEKSYLKILCKCPKCDLYYNERDLWEHWDGDCSTIKGSKCGQCDITIGGSSVEAHIKMHQSSYVTVKSLLLVDYVLQADVNSRKRTYSKAELSSELEHSNKKSRPIYFCTKCDSCTFKSLNVHSSGQCIKFKLPRTICKICGLLFSSTKHQKFHQTFPKIKLQDSEFFNLKTRKKIPPPIPNYPRCNKCLVHFVSLVAQLKHECNEQYETCPHCKKKFSDLALRLHLPLHRTMITKSKASVSKDMPELLKKYEQLTNIWNLLYMCKDCSVACDSYDKMVEHSQDHFCKPKNDYGVIKECKKCSLKLDSASFSNHQNLHAANSSLNSSYFRIITYDYSKLFTEEWFDVLKDLPKDQTDRIVSTSIYQFTRGIRMSAVNNVKSEDKLYKCAKCKKYLYEKSLKIHHETMGCSITSKSIKCHICKLYFASQAGLRAHIRDHKKYGNKNPINYTMVLLNKEGDEKYNEILSRLDCITPIPKYRPYQKNFFLRLYECKKCKCCITQKHNIVRHNCPRRKSLKQCPKCNLHFMAHLNLKHLALHKEHPKLTKSDIDICLFDPDTKMITNNLRTIPASNKSSFKTSDKTSMVKTNSKVSNLIFKCRCGLHFTSQSLFLQHHSKCGVNNVVSSENCSQCGLLFPTDILVSHLLRHHRGSNAKHRFKIISHSFKHTLTLHKCIKCQVCFSSQSSLRRHSIDLKHAPIKSINCDRCDLCLTLHSFRIHNEIHKNALSHFIIKEYAGTKVVDTKIVPGSKGTSKQEDNKKEDVKTSDMELSDHDSDENKMPDGSADEYKAPDESQAPDESKAPEESKAPFESKTPDESSDIKLSKQLIKCIRCGLHMMTTTDFRRHKQMRCYDKSIKSQSKHCPLCRLPFITDNLKKHLLVHHKQMNLKLRNFKISLHDPLNRKILSKFELQESTKTKMLRRNHKNVLYTCTKCNLCYISSRALEQHNCDSVKVECDLCAYAFTMYTLPRHKEIHHVLMKLQREDFKIVTLDNMYLEIAKGNIIETQPGNCESYNEKNDKDFSQYKETEYFDNKAEDTTNSTVSKIDNKLKEDIKTIDTDVVSQENDDCNIISEKPIDESTDTEISRKLIKCMRCGLHMLTTPDFRRHQSTRCYNKSNKSQSEHCPLCRLPFIKENLKMHLLVHHKQMNCNFHDFKITLHDPLKRRILSTFKLSERSKSNLTSVKYTNVLYQCTNCSICFLSHRTEKKHNCTSSKEECEQCAYLFTLYSLPRHKEIHHNIMKLKREDLKIILEENIERTRVSNQLVFDEDEGTQPDNREARDGTKYVATRQKFNNSIKKVEETVVERKISESKELLILFKCTKCNICFSSLSSLKRHVIEANHAVVESFHCHQCDLHFTQHSFKVHNKMHQNYENGHFTVREYIETTMAGEKHVSVKKEELGTIDKKLSDKLVFEENEDAQFDNIRSYNEMRRKECIKKSDAHKLLHMCSKCCVHFLKYKTVINHKHPVSVVKCNICGLLFSRWSIKRHKAVQHGKYKLKRKDFIIKQCLKEDKTILNETEIETSYNTSIKDSDSDTCNKSANEEEEGNLTPTIEKSSIADRYKNNSGARNDTLGQLEMEDSSFNSDTRLLQEEDKDKNNSTSKTEESHVVNQYRNKKLRNYTLKSFVKMALDRVPYGNKVYKCNKCTLHYLDEESVRKHESICDGSVRAIVCNICGKEFSYVTLEKHSYVHHERMGLKRHEVFVADRVNSNPKVTLYKCGDCETHFTEEVSLNIHMLKKSHKVIKKSCKVCKLQFSIVNLNNHFEKHHKQLLLGLNDFIIEERSEKDESSPAIDNVSSMEVDVSVIDSSSKNNSQNSNVPKIYKCSECDVYFNNLPAMNKHTGPHKKLDTKEFIDCKICSLPFKILSLQNHVQTHHVDGFDFDNVLIEECLPKTQGFVKINTYFVKDKIQSKLVSTTSDISSTELKDKIEGIAIDTSNNENVQKDKEGVNVKSSEKIKEEEMNIENTEYVSEPNVKIEINSNETVSNANPDVEMDSVENTDILNESIYISDDEMNCHETATKSDENIETNGSENSRASIDVITDCVQAINTSHESIDISDEDIDSEETVTKSNENIETNKSANSEHNCVNVTNESHKSIDMNDEEIDAVETIAIDLDKFDDNTAVNSNETLRTSNNDDCLDVNNTSNANSSEAIDCIDLT